jgi:hypothetical protein
MSLGTHIPIFLYQTNRQLSRLVNRFRHCRNSSLGCIKHEEKSECMHPWTRWTFPILNIIFFSDVNVIYFLTNRTRVRNELLFDHSVCICVCVYIYIYIYIIWNNVYFFHFNGSIIKVVCLEVSTKKPKQPYMIISCHKNAGQNNNTDITNNYFKMW